jgi:hypothetical protein
LNFNNNFRFFEILNKHSSLLSPFVSYEENKVLLIEPLGINTVFVGQMQVLPSRDRMSLIEGEKSSEKDSLNEIELLNSIL